LFVVKEYKLGFWLSLFSFPTHRDPASTKLHKIMWTTDMTVSRATTLAVMALLLVVASKTAGAASVVPLLYCANESADPDECQLELENARETILPWFAQYDRKERHRQLLDCRRFCRREQHLTFQMPCQCVSDRRRRQLADGAPQRSVKAAEAEKVTPLVGPLEGPIQVFRTFAAQMSEGRCKEKLGQMKCFVTFVSSYEAIKPSLDALSEMHFIDSSPPPGSAESQNLNPSKGPTKHTHTVPTKGPTKHFIPIPFGDDTLTTESPTGSPHKHFEVLYNDD
jgi:hypothetical protein